MRSGSSRSFHAPISRVRQLASLGFALYLRPPQFHHSHPHHPHSSYPDLLIPIDSRNHIKWSMSTLKTFSTSEFRFTHIRAEAGYTYASAVCSHSWSHVNLGICHKYPNPKCAHVISVDVVDRSVDPATGVIRTERILGCKQAAPRWIVKVSPHDLYCVGQPS